MATPGSRRVRSMVALLEAQAYEIRSLQRAIRNLEGRLEVLVGLDALVADELRGPVATIERHLEELRVRARDPRGQTLVNEGLAHVRSIHGVIGELVHPQEIGPTPLERARLVTVPLDGLVEQVLTLMAHSLERSRVEVDLPSGFMITTAPRRVVAILANLFENAAAHGGHGPIECRAEALGDRLAIEVSDRGPGLGGVDPEALFQPVASDDGDDDGNEVTGLYLVRMLARSLGGAATVADRAGGGMCARVELPHRREGEADSDHSRRHVPVDRRS